MEFITDNLKEIVIAVISFFAGMTTQVFIHKTRTSIRQRQHAGDNSNQIQSGGSTNTNRPR
jgi:hypothetical protein